MERIYKGLLHKLTEKDKEEITKYYNEQNLDRVIEFCGIIAVVASNRAWINAELYLKEVGLEGFLKDCSTCGRKFDCEPEFALGECGDRYKGWVHEETVEVE